MYEKLNKLGLSISFLIAVILLVIGAVSYANNESVELAIDFGYVLLGIGILTAVGIPLFQAIKEPKRLIMPLGGLLVIAIIFGLSWTFSDGFTNAKQALDLTSNQIRLSGSLLLMTRAIVFIGLGGILFTEIRNALFK